MVSPFPSLVVIFELFEPYFSKKTETNAGVAENLFIYSFVCLFVCLFPFFICLFIYVIFFSFPFPSRFPTRLRFYCFSEAASIERRNRCVLSDTILVLRK